MPAPLSACDVICIGLIGADHVCAHIAVWPPPGTLIRTPGITLTVGGSGANVSVDLAKLGISVAMVGCVGNDISGRFLQQELESHGVNCELLATSPGTETATTLVINVEGEDRRFIHSNGASTELTGLELSDNWLDCCRVLCVAGLGLNPELSGENVAMLFRQARSRGVVTMLDVVFADAEQAASMARVCLPETDYFLPNTDEARLMTGITDPDAQAEHFLKQGAGTVVITLGAGGLVAHGRNHAPIRMPAHAVLQVDGTGGGDAFDAGFIYALLKGKSLADCLSYGSALGASCVQSTGATTGVFNAEQLEAFVAAHPLRSTSDRTRGQIPH